MGLNLKEFIREDDFIDDVDGTRYIITADISREFFDKYSEVIGECASIDMTVMKPDELNKIMDRSRTVCIELLSIKNEREKVTAFIEKLSAPLFTKVFQYIGEYLSGSISDKKKLD